MLGVDPHTIGGRQATTAYDSTVRRLTSNYHVIRRYFGLP